MPRHFNSSFTMFVYLNGHQLLEYYFDLSDTRLSANDRDGMMRGAGGFASPGEPRA